jgi:hypothetical protein
MSLVPNPLSACLAGRSGAAWTPRIQAASTLAGWSVLPVQRGEDAVDLLDMRPLMASQPLCIGQHGQNAALEIGCRYMV